MKSLHPELENEENEGLNIEERKFEEYECS